MKQKNNKVLWFFVFIALIALTFYTIISQTESFTLEAFVTFIKTASWPWVVMAFLCMLCFILFEGLALRMLCKTFGYKRPLKRNVTYSAVDIYFSALTPSATGGQPASAMFMMHDKIPGAVTTIILIINLTLYTAAIAILGIGCFLIRPSIITHFSTVSQIMIFVGFILQIILIVFFAMLVYKEKIVMVIANACMKLLYKMKLLRNVEKKQQRLQEVEKQYKECASAIMKHKKSLLLVFLFNLLQRVSVIMVSVCIFLSKGGDIRKALDVFITQGYVVVGSNSIPIPGAVGAADYLFIDGFGHLVSDPVSIELFSRGISFYCCVIICGIITLVAYLSKGLKGLKQKKNDRVL